MNDQKTCTFQILCTSDVHGAFRDYVYAQDKEAPEGGFSKLATLMRQDRENFSGKTFIIDVGDIIQGNATGPLVNDPSYSEKFKPYPLLAAYDALGYDMVVLGNHEFNFGIPNLLNAFDGFKGEKLCGNVRDSEGRLLDGFSSYTVKTLDCGLRIAFIGVVSPNIDVWDERNVKDAGYVAQDARQVVKDIITQIKKHNTADIIIVLGHMHTHNELRRSGSGAIDVAEMNEIDLFLGAHFHTRVDDITGSNILPQSVKFVENLDSGKSYARVFVTATCENGHWSVADRIDDVTAEVVVLKERPETQNLPEIEAVTQKAHKAMQQYTRRIVGELKGGPLVPEPEIAGTHEAILGPTPLIHLLGKVMRAYSKAEIAAVTLNKYEANCPEGPISRGKVAGMYIYENNTVYRVKMTGAQLKKWMEWSYEFFGGVLENGQPDPGPAVNLETDLTIAYGASPIRKVYLHDIFEGINYEIDLTQPSGSRITIIGTETGPFDPERIYTIATTNYRATTNLLRHTDDGVFTDDSQPTAEIDGESGKDIRSPKEKTDMLDWIEEYIQDQSGVITTVVEQNRRFVNLNWEQPLRMEAIKKINNGSLTVEYTYKKPLKKNQL